MLSNSLNQQRLLVLYPMLDDVLDPLLIVKVTINPLSEKFFEFPSVYSLILIVKTRDSKVYS